MNRRILFDDDEKNIVEGYKRNLRHDFDVFFSIDPIKALEIMQTQKEFAVIISDYKMPHMNGVEFLNKAASFSPNSVRIILTGNADLSIAIKAVNQCNVFRFLTKPCPIDEIRKIIDEGLKQYKLNSTIEQNFHKTKFSSELIPVCSHCKKIRKKNSDPFTENNWESFEVYFSREYGFRFSHGLCPSCIEELYSELKISNKIKK